MQKIHLFLILLSIILLSCSEENDISLQIGEWEVVEERKNYKNDSLYLEETRSLILNLEDNSKGLLSVGIQSFPVYWVEDKTDNSLILVQDFNGSGTLTNKFNIISNDGFVQEWEEIRNSENISTGDQLRWELKWMLTLKE